VSDLLPPTLRFLEVGWWISDVILIVMIGVWAYRKCRRDEKKARLYGSESKRPRD